MLKNEGKNLDNGSIGRFLNSLFPNLKSKQGRSKRNWTIRTTIYYGIAWVPDNKYLSITFLGIEKTARNCCVIERSVSSVTLGHFTGHLINGNRVIAEIIFNSNNMWSCVLFGKQINLSQLGIGNTYELTDYGINNVIKNVDNLKYCNGVTDTAEKCNSDFIVENWSKVGDENSYKKRCRSTKCSITLPLSCYNNICQKCCLLTKPIELETEEEEVILTPEDHTDFIEIPNKVIPDCPERLKVFLISQEKAVTSNPKARRWNKDLIRICLSLWCRSPRGYSDLRSSGFIILPSSRLLQYYKNSINQVSGLNKEMMIWMMNEAKTRNLPIEGYEGGILLDEMSIESDIQFSKKGGGINLIGLVDVTEESEYIKILKTQKNEVALASHVLQFLFLGVTGFRFPFAHFATTGAPAFELYLTFWKAVHMLSLYGFKVTFISMDGAQSNRDFMNILLGQPETPTFTVSNIYDPSSPEISLIMDYSHTIKKIRNNIYKSGTQNYDKRKLLLNSKYVFWDHWRKAYFWDISTNPLPIHRKLKQDHLFLTSEAKMRNHLAEEVLDQDMHHLMIEYQKSLAQGSSDLDSLVELLSNTSILVKNFRDCRPITDISDKRLKENDNVLDFFKKWENSILQDPLIKNKEKCLISHQTRQDISSMIVGFKYFCVKKLNRFSGSSIIPSRMNSDPIENVFCQERSLHNGATTNPTYLGYCRTINSIILGESTISRKSNTGGKGAEPFSYHTKNPLNPPKKSKN